MKQVVVIGASQPNDERQLSVAYEVGKEIAKRKAVLVCGGRTGVMEAACRGAKEHGGITVGILPSEDGEDANDYVDIRLPTGMGYGRNFLVVLASSSVIAIGGGCGTMSELGMAYAHGKRIIALGVGGWSEKVLETGFDEGKSYGAEILRARDAREAVELALRK